jgi:hypothetical protein
MTSDMKISVPDDLRQAVEAAAQADGKTVDELGVEALKQHLARRALDRLKREAEKRRGGKTDAEVEAIVERAVSEHRADSRSR